jgi:hypothetical protein
MSSFAFMHPVVAFKCPSLDILKFKDRVYDFWDKKVTDRYQDTDIVDGTKITNPQEDPILKEEIDKLVKESIVPAVNTYVIAIATENVDGDPPIAKLHVGNVWVNVLHPGAHQPNHVHGNSHLTGVFYLQSSKDSGRIHLSNPHLTGIEPLFHTSNIMRSLDNEIGNGWLWASNLPHHLDINRSDHDQISIGFTVHIDSVYGDG